LKKQEILLNNLKMSVKTIFKFLIVVILFLSCTEKKENKHNINTRQLIDTIGFTQYNWQFDSIIARINPSDKKSTNQVYKAVICPHDDYAYAAGLYSKTLKGIKAKNIVLIGVAHKARNFNLENKLVFGTYDQWKCNDQNIPVSPFRDALVRHLSKDIFVLHDSMMQLEHSLEAINPFLLENNKDIEIIPILVPYMTFENMELFSDKLSASLFKIMNKEKLNFGKDIAIVISNDAIHYGNSDWGGSNLAPFGVDSLGNAKAKQKDRKIIDACLKGDLSFEKIKKFNSYTVDKENFKKYKWTWCGRYSVPFGLMFANKLNFLINKKPLEGVFVDYRSSYPGMPIKVKDIGMGYTAPAKPSHWVGYTGISYQ